VKTGEKFAPTPHPGLTQSRASGCEGDSAKETKIRPLGFSAHDEPSERGGAPSCIGTPTKTRLTEIRPVEIDVPQDIGSTFDPQIVRNGNGG
jgi:hypothetical protein